MIIRTLPSPVYSEDVIVDNEISNDISDEFNDWHYDRADIICCGILHKDSIVILFKEHNDSIDEYKNILREHLDKFPSMFAFNRNMESGNFKGFLARDYNVGEIKAFNGRGWNKEKFFQELINDGKVTHIPVDELKDNSALCIDSYGKKEYEKIISHNSADLIKQAYLLQNKSYLIDKYKDVLDKNGFVIQKYK